MAGAVVPAAKTAHPRWFTLTRLGIKPPVGLTADERTTCFISEISKVEVFLLNSNTPDTRSFPSNLACWENSISSLFFFHFVMIMLLSCCCQKENICQLSVMVHSRTLWHSISEGLASDWHCICEPVLLENKLWTHTHSQNKKHNQQTRTRWK